MTDISCLLRLAWVRVGKMVAPGQLANSEARIFMYILVYGILKHTAILKQSWIVIFHSFYCAFRMKQVHVLACLHQHNTALKTVFSKT